jgi:phosphotriesterase-related protein
MATAAIQTVTGPITPDQLGPTLMHEHLLIGYPGWEAHTTHDAPTRAELLKVCIDRIAELKAAGFRSMIDPCPNDLGRDVEFAAEVASRAGFNIICATGLYKESEGGAAYWHMRSNFGSQVGAMAELFERELRDGVGRTGIRPGIIKLATGHGQMSAYERTIFEAAARAAVATGAPITTHTDQGTLGDVQQKLLVDAGVASQRIVIGHSCGTSDRAYHMGIARGGSYLGFDRFGLDALHPDAERTKALLALLAAGAGDRVVISHDSVWCWRGQPFGSAEAQRRFAETHSPLHFTRKIEPELRRGGASEAQIRALTIDNPRRFFAGDKLPALA